MNPEVLYIFRIILVSISWTAAAKIVYKSCTMFSGVPWGIRTLELRVLDIVLNFSVIFAAVTTLLVFLDGLLPSKFVNFLLLFSFLIYAIKRVARGKLTCLLSLTYYGCWTLLFLSNIGLFLISVVNKDDKENGPANVVLATSIIEFTARVCSAAVYLALTAYTYQKSHVCLASSDKILSAFFLCDMCSMFFSGIMLITNLPMDASNLICSYMITILGMILPGVLLLMLMDTDVKEMRMRLEQHLPQVQYETTAPDALVINAPPAALPQ